MSASASSSGLEFEETSISENNSTVGHGPLLLRMWNDVESLQRRNDELQSELGRTSEKLGNMQGLIAEECKGQLQEFMNGIRNLIATTLSSLVEMSESMKEMVGQDSEKLESLLGIISALEEKQIDISRKVSSLSEATAVPGGSTDGSSISAPNLSPSCNHSCMTGEELTSKLAEIKDQFLERIARKTVRSEGTQVEMEAPCDQTAVSTDVDNSLVKVTSEDGEGTRGSRQSKKRPFKEDESESDNQPSCDSESSMPALELEVDRRMSGREAAKTARTRLAKTSRGRRNT